MKVTHIKKERTRLLRNISNGRLIAIAKAEDRTSNIVATLKNDYAEVFLLSSNAKKSYPLQYKIVKNAITQILNNEMPKLERIEKNKFERLFKRKVLQTMNNPVKNNDYKNSELVLLYEIITKDNNESNCNTLKLLLEKRRDLKIESLSRSIANNKIGMQYVNGKLTTTKRYEIIVKAIKNEIDLVNLINKDELYEFTNMIKTNNKSEIITIFKEKNYFLRKKYVNDENMLFVIDEIRSVFFKLIDKESKKDLIADLSFNTLKNKNDFKKMVENEIYNKLKNTILQVGKTIKYGINSSQDLEDLRIKEELVKSLIALFMSTNNKLNDLYNIKEDNDITTSKGKKIINLTDNKNDYYENFVNELLFDYNDEIKSKFFSLFEGDIEDAPLIKKLTDFRNKSYHFKDVEFTNFLTEIEDENPIYNEIYQVDIDRIKDKVLEKIKSMNLLYYYDENFIKTIFQRFYFSLNKKNLAFMPAFNNVFKYILNNFSDLVYNPAFKDEKYDSYFSFLKMIYYNGFLTSENRKKYISASIRKIINDKDLLKEEQKFRKLLSEVEYADDEVKYFQDLQSLISLQSIQSDKSLNIFKKYLQKIYANAFIDYLSNDIMFKLNDFIPKEKNTKNDNYSKIVITSRKDEIDIDISKELYVFLKFADNDLLNDIKGNMVKYQQFLSKNRKNDDYKTIEKFIYMIELAIISKPIYSIVFQKDNMYQQRLLEKYSDIGIKFNNYPNIYYNESDLKFLRHGIYGINDKSFTILSKNKDYNETILNNNIDKKEILDLKIDQLQEERKKIHEKIIANPKDMSELTKFKEIVKNINAYHNTTDIISLRTFRQVVSLFKEVRNKVIEYIYLFERDLVYAYKAYYYFNNQKEKMDRVEKDDSNIIGYEDNLIKSPLSKQYEIMNIHISMKEKKRFLKIFRNTMCHHNITKDEYKIDEVINNLRKILSYDRKLKNSVSKSFKNIFANFGIELKTSTNNKHEINIQEITKKKDIEYFKKIKHKPKYVDSTASDNFLDLVKKYFL